MIKATQLMFRSFSTKKHLKFVKNSVAFVALAASVLAQTDCGSIRGTITDQTGAVVPGVSVTVSNSATGVSNSVRSNDTGVYGIAALPAGAYRVEVTPRLTPEPSVFAARMVWRYVSRFRLREGADPGERAIVALMRMPPCARDGTGRSMNIPIAYGGGCFITRTLSRTSGGAG
jgi:hypothetical protein